MSTNLKSNTADVMLTRYYGGSSRGTCIQVTTTYTADPNDFFKHINLSRDEARTLAADLMAFAASEEVEEIG